MEQKAEKKHFLYPKSEKDYVRIWRWKVSRPLAWVLGVIVCIISIYYIIWSDFYTDQIRGRKPIYNYDSLFLKFISGNVRIKAEAGYIAYEGYVEKGEVTGQGILYGRDGNVIYEGEFEENEYSGSGRLYGENGGILYEGELKHNVYEGDGVQYTAAGLVKYEGAFHSGLWNGKGILYDDSSNQVYEGNFLNGSIVYEDFLGKTTNEAASMYTGRRDIYYDDTYFIADMKDIDAIYSGSASNNSLEDTVTIAKVFVKGESCHIGGRTAGNIEEVKEIAGTASYEGNVYISTEEAVALSGLSGLEVTPLFDDAMEITGYDENRLIYIYTFQVEQLQYTFYSETNNGEFILYSIELI